MLLIIMILLRDEGSWMRRRWQMPLSAGVSFVIIFLVAATTFATRVVPFLIFPKGKEIPEVVRYLGRVLTPAVIGMLVVYCLRATPVAEAPWDPEAAAVFVTAALHAWKRNNLLSIGVGTVLYMVLIQVFFRKKKKAYDELQIILQKHMPFCANIPSLQG